MHERPCAIIFKGTNFVSVTLYIIAIHETVVRLRLHYVRQSLVNVAFATELSASGTIFILSWSNLLVLVSLKEIWRVTFLPNFIFSFNIWRYNYYNFIVIILLYSFCKSYWKARIGIMYVCMYVYIRRAANNFFLLKVHRSC